MRPGLRGPRVGGGLPQRRGVFTGGDSIVLALKELEGYTLTEYQAQGADFEAKDRRLILMGTPENKAQIIADGQELTADSLFYNEETGKVWSAG